MQFVYKYLNTIVTIVTGFPLSNPFPLYQNNALSLTISQYSSQFPNCTQNDVKSQHLSLTDRLKKTGLILLQLKYSSFKTLKYRSNILLMFKIYYAFDRNEFLTLQHVNSDFCLNLALILASPVSVSEVATSGI